MNLRVAVLVGLLALLLGSAACAAPAPAGTGRATLAPVGSASPLPGSTVALPARVVPPVVTSPSAPLSTVRAPVSPAPVASGPRPRTGAVIDAHGPRGEGEVEVENGTSHDGLLTLARDGRAVRSVYVRAGDETTMSGVRDGVYEVFFTTGDGWNAELGRFTSAEDYERFPGTSEFETTTTEYSIWSFTLQPVPDGDVEPEAVAPGDYPG